MLGMTAGRAGYWNAAYEERGAEGVSWYQTTPVVSLELIGALGVSYETPVIDIGGGASSLATSLVDRGFTDVTVLDISSSALAMVEDPHAAISRVEADVLRWVPTRQYGLWHDRATFHFLVSERDRATYVCKLEEALAPGGLAIVATFAPDGPPTCSGLPVMRYSENDLDHILGPSFELLESRREEHRTPRDAVQPFTWIAGRLRDAN